MMLLRLSCFITRNTRLAMAKDNEKTAASREFAKIKNFEAQIQIWEMIIDLQSQPPSDENNARIALCYIRLRQAGANLLVLDGNAFYEFEGDTGNEKIP